MPKPSDPTKIQLLSTPLYHITATKSRLGGSTFQGGAVAFMHHWNARDCLYVVSRMRISSIGGVPTMFFGVAEEVERFRALNENVDLSCITSFSYGGAPAPPALVKKLRELFPNVLIGQGLGQTEASNCVSVAGQDYLDHPGSVGRVNPVSELKIVEVTDWNTVPDGHVDKVLGVGEVGEVCSPYLAAGSVELLILWFADSFVSGARMLLRGTGRIQRARRGRLEGGGYIGGALCGPLDGDPHLRILTGLTNDVSIFGLDISYQTLCEDSGDVGYIDKDGFVYLVDRLVGTSRASTMLGFDDSRPTDQNR